MPQYTTVARVSSHSYCQYTSFENNHVLPPYITYNSTAASIMEAAVFICSTNWIFSIRRLNNKW